VKFRDIQGTISELSGNIQGNSGNLQGNSGNFRAPFGELVKFREPSGNLQGTCRT
jgi:hypothetical protein